MNPCHITAELLGRRQTAAEHGREDLELVWHACNNLASNCTRDEHTATYARVRASETPRLVGVLLLGLIIWGCLDRPLWEHFRNVHGVGLHTRLLCALH